MKLISFSVLTRIFELLATVLGRIANVCEELSLMKFGVDLGRE
jgi:hypothetical protein